MPKNMKTTLMGLLGAVAVGITTIVMPALKHEPLTMTSIMTFLSALAAAFGFHFAADKPGA